MHVQDWLMILAVLLSPFLAVFAQRKIDLSRERRGQKLWIFRTLMATRGNRLSLDHVQALNSIELIFDDPKSNKEVVRRWNEYLDHFSQGPQENDKDFSAKMSGWNSKGDDLLAELLHTMGQSLGYDFDKVKLKRGFYAPKGHGDEQNDQLMIRKGLSALLQNKSPLAVKLISEDVSPAKGGNPMSGDRSQL